MVFFSVQVLELTSECVICKVAHLCDFHVCTCISNIDYRQTNTSMLYDIHVSICFTFSEITYLHIHNNVYTVKQTIEDQQMIL